MPSNRSNPLRGEARGDRPKKKPRSRGFGWPRLLLLLVAVPLTGVVAAALAVALMALLANDRLPSLDALVEYRPKIPLRVFTADGVLIGEFGEERRNVVHIAQVPAVMKNAILAAEDTRFFEHSGVDFQGVVRAALGNLMAGGIESGASTITQQLAKNFFLSSEKTYTRKIYEVLLALKIEKNLTKEQILEVYINQIFLGKRAYGFASAAQIYFGKPLARLSAAEAAMLAGLPKAPSRFNPIENPKRATERQRYILRRMHEAGFISEGELDAALKEELHYVDGSGNTYAVQAPYVAELARQLAFDQFREDTYTAGINVYTTVLAEDQRAANLALKAGVIDYDRKHGYRGPEAFLDLPADPQKMETEIENALSDASDVDDFLAAVVLSAEPKQVVVTRGHKRYEIGPEGLKFVAQSLTDRAPAARRIRRGAVVRIVETKANQFELTQVPEVESALVSCNTADGSVRALVGGFHFDRNKFNRVTQAWRQPGSSFKPFIYSASLDKGLMTTTLINDAPIVVPASVTGSQVWEPKNYDGKFEGPMTMRTALQKSKNMVSIRILQTIGTQYAQDYVTRFGFEPEKHPAYLTMALGAGSVTPWQMVGAVSVFANGGYRIEPYIINRITNAEGKLIAQAHPVQAGDESLRAIDARNAFIMDSMLRDVVRRGTATRALALKRTDLAGKTGTTNDSIDAWFVGYQPSIAAVAWVGFDQPRKLGDRETGGGLALPIWVSYMGKALKGVPDAPREVPPGIASVGGDYYYAETQPGQGIAAIGLSEGGVGTGDQTDEIRDQVF